ncbi:MAG: dsbD [Burkholderiaceae bacterium]|nr:dsbD [Burkholderiaceae bacterium]
MLGMLLSTWVAHAQTAHFDVVKKQETKKFLPAGMVFQMNARASAPNQYTLTWRVAQGYYLYKDQMKIVATDGATVSSVKWTTPTQSKDDPTFGQVQVFHNQAIALVTVNTSKVTTGQPRLNVQYQGCADGGLCYPPINAQVALNMANTPASVDKTAATPADTNKVVVNASNTPNAPNTSTTAPNTSTASTTSNPPASVTPTPVKLPTDSGSFSQFLNTTSLPMILGTLLLLGVGLAFTPCVFPMMPILTSVIAGEDKKNLTPMRGFKLSLTYVLGMALVYALLGSLMGALGARANLAVWLQKPPVIIASATLFVVLALSMFGLFTLQLPTKLQNRLNQLSNQQKGGRMTGAFVMGAISALVVSPCVSAPLVGVLGFISTTGQAGMGALALFTLGLGMGIPLIVLGTTGGAFLPKAGAWMDAVKGVFGIGLLAVAIGLLERILPPALSMVLWAVLCAGAAVWMGAFAQAHTRMAQVLKALGLLLFAHSVALLIGAWSGQTNPLKPLAGVSFGRANMQGASAGSTVGVPFKTIKTIDELNVELVKAKQAAKPVVLDLVADWCTSCKVMERTTFMDAQVVARLSHYTALRLDITDTSSEHNAWMQTQGIFGPPVVQFYDAQGRELQNYRVTGEANASEFLEKIPQ